ncbi:MAG: nucleotidyltransferase domain-containing protein [Syntrophothermus sp.]|uniref:nucleotidyltransferase family protein n=1 Tax=Syntrophothermus sp. TaxID=2736299 RepID=UPI00257B26A8|nr:nucleotidyltransferase domain-containing protein [Syntrophothermus sp.]NSW83202.1 nucleotidyltransferase domain-containing protein [Syntrophothermus sp.]
MAKGKDKVDINDYRVLRRRLLGLEERKKERLYRLAWQRASDVATMLKERYGAGEVYLYGSLAWGGFDEHSDIDLFVVGLSGEYWQAYIDAEAAASPFRVSVACAEDCTESLKAKVKEKGVRL